MVVVRPDKMSVAPQPIREQQLLLLLKDARKLLS